MGYQPYKKEQEIHILELLKYLTVSMFLVVVCSLLLKATLAGNGNFRQTLFFEKPNFSYSGENIDIEIGDKTTGQDQVVKFSTIADQKHNLTGKIFNAIFGQKQYDIEFALVNVMDSTNVESVINSGEIDPSAVVNNRSYSQKNDKLIIKNVIDDIDVEISPLEKTGLKENIIVNGSKGAVYDSYLYELNLDEGMILHKVAPGSSIDLPVGTYYFTDEQNNYIAHFLPLIAHDSNGNETKNISMEILPVVRAGLAPAQGDLEGSPLRYVITITIDKNWLSDPDLQYPVIIDPTIVHNTQGEFQAGEENRLQTTSDPRVELKYHELPADINTVGLWHFDESSGQTVNDSSINNNDGQLGSTSGSDSQDPTWNTTSQKLGDSALSFAEDDYVSITDDLSLKLTNEMTAEAWIKGDGNTISTIQRTTNTDERYEPQFQVAGNKIYYTWMEHNDSWYQIWTASSNSDGSEWDSIKRTTTTPQSKYNPQLQVVGDKIYYAWSEFYNLQDQIWTATSNTDGSGWSMTQRTSNNSRKGNVQFQVVGTKIYFVWREYTGSYNQIWTATMNTDGTGWSAIQRTTSNYNKEYPQLQVVGDNIYFVWTERSGLFYQIWTATMKTDGSNWSATSRTSGNTSRYYPQQQVIGSKIYYTWYETDGDYQIWSGVVDLISNSWSATKLTDSNYDKTMPQLQVTGNKINYVWQEDDGSNNQIWIAGSDTDSQSFSTTKIIDNSYSKYSPQMQIVGSKFYFFYLQNDGTDDQIWTASYGSNIINKGDFYGLGIVGNTVEGFANGGIDTMKYNASAVSYSNGAMAEGTIDSTSWHHIAATFDGATINTYINGILTGTMTNPMPISTNGTSMTDYPLIIGDSFDGDIDEIKISNRALSPEEIYYDAQLRPYGEYTSDVIDLGINNPNYNSLSWEEYGVRTSDGETLENDQSLVAQWNFNETSGTTASDASGNGHTGTLTNFSSTGSQDAAAGTGWTANNRKWGTGSLMMDGTDDYVTVTHDSNLNPNTDSFSVAAWINLRACRADDYNSPIATKAAGDFDNGYSLLISGYVSDVVDCSPVFNVDTAGGPVYQAISTRKITPGWHYLVGVLDRNDDKVRIFVDGSLIDEQDGPGTTTIDPSNNLEIGRYNRTSRSRYEYFGGVIDSTQIYARALDADEILSNYQAGKIELQTRTGSDDTPEDGGWEEWKPADAGVITQLDDMDVNEENSFVYDWSIQNNSINQKWVKLNNSIPTRSDSSSTDGRIPFGNFTTGDDSGTSGPSVIYENGSYKMWYNGLDGSTGRIYYATSSDGLTWTKYDNTIPSSSNTTSTNGRIPLGTSGRGDSSGLAKGSVIKDGSTYKMWYAGSDGSNLRIYYATSPDGLTWTKYDNTIPSNSNTTSTNGRIPLGTSGRGDSSSVTNPHVIKDGSIYKMWYQGSDGSSARIFQATSPDGLNWTKTDNTIPTSSNQVSTNGRIALGISSGDSVSVFDPHVIKDGSTYKMWYSGASTTVHYRIFYATSIDGQTWVKFNNTTPLTSNSSSTEGRVPLGTSGTGDESWVSYPSVIKTDQGYMMWYRGATSGDSRIYFAQLSAMPYGLNSDESFGIENGKSTKINVGYIQPDEETVGLWHFEETAGSSDYLKDVSGNGYNGTPNGTSISTGYSGQSRYFNGISDNINLSSHISGLEGRNQGTIEMWFKSTAAGPIFSITDKDANTDLAHLYVGSVTSLCDDESISYYLRRGGTNQLGMFVREGHEKYLDGAWHHVVVATGDGDNRIFIDGERKAIENCSFGSVSANEFTNINNPDSIYIGHYDTLGTDLYHTGNIDEVRISDVARTPEEIAEAYRAGASHYLTRSLASPVDLSSNNKLTYYIASDSPGTHINTTVGESPYANGQPDTNTVGLWHLDGDNKDKLTYDLSGTTIRTIDWVEVDPNANKISQNNGIVLSAGTVAAWDSGVISRGTFAREAGKQLYARFRTSTSVAPPNHMMIGWGQNQTSSGSYSTLTHGLYFNGGTFYVYQDGASTGGPYGSGYVANTTYEVRITLLSNGGARYEIKGGVYTNWTTLLATDNAKVNESLRVQIAQYRHTGTFQEISVLDNPIAVDSSGYNHEGRGFETKTTQGKTGNARYFDGIDDYVTVLDSDGLSPSSVTLDAWVKINSYKTSSLIVGKGGEYWFGYDYTSTGCTASRFGFMVYDGDWQCASSSFQPQLDTWYHLTGTLNGSNIYIYVNGQLSGGPVAQGAIVNSTNNFDIGSYSGAPYSYAFNGTIDEVRLSNTIRTAEEIRQAYEIGKRTHMATIDFGASLDSGNLISGSGDTSFTVDATTRGLSQKASNLFIGDKIIVRENYDGTEYIAQGTVNTVNQSTGAVTVFLWDAGGTFPSGGYTANADVFKWQKETFDIFGAMPSHIDAIDELSFRFLDGNQGRTFWIDDIGIVANDGYLTDNTNATITSTPNQYFQYKAILTTTDPDPTPGLGPITLDYEGDLSMTAASTSQSYMNTNNIAAFNIQCNGVTASSTGNTVTCYGSWNQTNWFEIDQTISPLSNATIQDDEDVSSWTGYPLGNGTVTLYARAGESGDYTDTFSFNIEKDVSRPAVTSITSVAGDTSVPYSDGTDNSSTFVVYTASADATSCKWDESDLTYGAMANTCISTTNCTLDLSGEGQKDVYFRCLDIAGNYSDSSYHLTYYIDIDPDIVLLDAGPSSSDRTSLTSDTWFNYSQTGSDDQISFVWTDPSSPSDDYFYYLENDSSVNAISNTNLVGWWNFEDDTITTALDHSGQENHATLYGTSTTSGNLGLARSFNGTSDYLHDNALASSIPGNLTVTGWIKASTIPVYQERIIDLAQAGDAGLQVCIDTSGNILLENSGGPSGVVYGGNATDNNWHHFAVTRSGTTYEFFVDGISKGTTSGSAPTYSQMYFGRRQTGGDFYAGQIDDTKIFTRALSSTEILNEYQIRLTQNNYLDSQTATEGTFYKHIRPINGVDSWGTEYQFIEKYDKTAPTLSASGNSEQWYSINPSITLTTIDNHSGLNYSKYSWDSNDSTCRSSGTNFNNSDSINIPSNGTHVLYLCNQDNVNNQNSWSGIYKLDNTTPDLASIDAGQSSADRTSLTSDQWFGYTDTGSDDQISFSWTDPASPSDDYFYYLENDSSVAAFNESDLAAWWNFENDNTATAWDHSVNNNEGTFNGSTISTGQLGNGRYFDGSDDEIQITDHNTLKPATNLTVSAWFKTEDKSIASQQIISKTRHSGYSLSLSNTQLCFAVSDGYNSYKYACISNAAINNDTWYHVAGTYDGSNVKLYLDGQFQTQTVMTTNIYYMDSVLCIGAEAGTLGNICENYYFKGDIDEAKIYTRTLTDTEINNEYLRRLTTNPYLDNQLVTEGIYYKHIRPFTGADNWGTERQFIEKYDKTNPLVSADNSSDRWYGSNPTITLSTTDTSSGINYSKYSWDSDDSTCRSSGTLFNNLDTINIISNGFHRLYLCNEDNTGGMGSWSGVYKLNTIVPDILAIDSGPSASDRTSFTTAEWFNFFDTGSDDRGSYIWSTPDSP